MIYDAKSILYRTDEKIGKNHKVISMSTDDISETRKIAVLRYAKIFIAIL